MNYKWLNLGHVSPLLYYPWLLFLTVSFDYLVGDRQILSTVNEVGKRTLATQMVDDYFAALIPSLLFYGIVILPLTLLSRRSSGKAVIIIQATGFLLTFGALIFSTESINSATVSFYLLLLAGIFGLPHLLASLQRVVHMTFKTLLQKLA